MTGRLTTADQRIATLSAVSRARLARLAVLAALIAACTSSSDATPVATHITTTEPTSTGATLTITNGDFATSSTTTPTTTQPAVELPAGVIVAVPIQNREDVALDQFQIRIHNDTPDRLDVIGLQFEWTGFATPMTARDTIVVAGQVVDFPLPFPGATCAGDGMSAPSLDTATVMLRLADGVQLDVAVVDQTHVAQTLYLDDCMKQAIEEQVAIEWVDLHEATFEGRPVTAGELRLTRRSGVGEFTVLSVSNTIPFVFEAVDSAVGEPVITLAANTDRASVPIRFVESRCDPHALGEIKQPTKFIAQVRLGDGSMHPYIVYPDRAEWMPMRQTADKACEALGKLDILEQG
jgi:hypothetical protein